MESKEKRIEIELDEYVNLLEMKVRLEVMTEMRAEDRFFRIEDAFRVLGIEDPREGEE